MRICKSAAAEGTGHAQAVDDELRSRIDHIALKIARRAHKLHGRSRKTNNCRRIFTAHGLRARHPVLDSAEARAQLDVAVNQRLKAAGYSFAMSTTQEAAYSFKVQDENGTCADYAVCCCVFTCCMMPIGVWMLRQLETTTDVQLIA